MKTINTLLKTILLITILSLSACKSDDDEGGNDAKTNSFTVDNETYSTPKAYLIISKNGINYNSDFMFAFADKTMREDNINGFSLATDANQFAFLYSDYGNTNFPSITEVTNQITTGSYSLTENTRGGVDVFEWDITYMSDSEQYGFPIGYIGYDLESSFSNTYLDIEKITMDVSRRTGTISCTYVFYSYNTGVEFRGEYEGPFEILVDSI